MKKLYVDEIYKKGGFTPGPSKYMQPRYFGSPDKSQNYSIAKRFPNDDLSLQRSAKLPGPGEYPITNLCGKSLQ